MTKAFLHTIHFAQWSASTEISQALEPLPGCILSQVTNSVHIILTKSFCVLVIVIYNYMHSMYDHPVTAVKDMLYESSINMCKVNVVL